jgi:hypothetical protein
MRRLATDREILRAIYDRYYGVFCSFDSAAPSRKTKVYVPIDIPAVAAGLTVDEELVFCRLHYHLEPKYGQPNGKSEIRFFLKDFPPNMPGAERHVVNFPLLEAVLASLEDEYHRVRRATWISVISVSVAILALAASILLNLFGNSLRKGPEIHVGPSSVVNADFLALAESLLPPNLHFETDLRQRALLAGSGRSARRYTDEPDGQ